MNIYKISTYIYVYIYIFSYKFIYLYVLLPWLLVPSSGLPIGEGRLPWPRSCNPWGIDWGGDTLKDYTKPRQTTKSPERVFKARTNLRKPRKTMQSPDRLYKAPKDYTKPRPTTYDTRY